MALEDPRPGRDRLEHVCELLYDQPHAVTAAKLAEVCELVEARLQSHATPEELAAYAAPAASDDRPPYSVTPGGVAVLPLQGVIAQRMGLMARYSGGTSSEKFAAAVKAAVDDPQVRGILLDVNSPGGAVSGTPEAAAAVFAARSGGKPVWAVANTQMDSAAYWIASAAERIFASPSASLGSIGVYMVHEETSARDARSGRKRTLVRAGRYKGIFEGVAPLEPAEQAHLQARVDGAMALFTEDVARHRGVSQSKVQNGFGEGASLLARAAVEAGLADEVAAFGEALAALEAHIADPSAGGSSLRAAAPHSTNPPRNSGVLSMEPRVKAALVAFGLAQPDVSDETAQAIVSGYFAGRGETVPSDPSAIVRGLTPKAAADAAAVPSEPVAKADTGSAEPAKPIAAAKADDRASADEIVERVHARIKADAEFRAATVRAQCDLVGLSAEETAQIVNLGLDAQSSAAEIKKLLAAKQPGISPLVPGPAHKDKWCTTVQQAIDARFAVASHGDPEAAAKDLAPEAREFLRVPLWRIAEQTLAMEGHSVRGMSRQQIAVLALQSGGHMVAASGMAYYGTGSFSNLMLNASHKLLVRAYLEAPSTWRQCFRAGDPAQDYKVHSLIQLSAAGNLEETPENSETPTDTSITDAREYYQVSKFTRKAGWSYESLVNDELDGLSRIQRMQGTAAGRTINALAWGIVTGNPTMADGGALFNATAVTTPGGHANLAGTGSTTAAPPTVALLSAMQGAMRIQRDINTESNIPLNIPIRYLIVPAALEQIAKQLLFSQEDPAKSNEARNPFYGSVVPVVEPLLDASSAHAWFGAADPAVVDTVLVVFLSGEETPLLESWWDPDHGTRFYKVQQSAVALAADYRGLQMHTGYSA